VAFLVLDVGRLEPEQCRHARPDVQAQGSGLRGYPSTATATTSAKPGLASVTSSFVTVLNPAAPVATAR
jgi:hypothetical protein